MRVEKASEYVNECMYVCKKEKVEPWKLLKHKVQLSCLLHLQKSFLEH